MSQAFVAAHTALARPPLVPEIVLQLATEITPIWQATEQFLDRHGIEPPFWAFAWPGSQAMVRHVLDHPACARGRRVLDFAAGGGLAAIACAMAGASHVEAAEIDAIACDATRLNAAANHAAVQAIHADLVGQPCRWDLILCGDVCYEAPMTNHILPWLRRMAAGAEVWIADPGRAYLPPGLAAFACYDVPTTHELEDRTMRRTTPASPVGLMARAVLLLLLVLAGCAELPSATPLHTAAQGWVAVLVAGDGTLPVFDDATAAMEGLLEHSGVPATNIHRLSAAPNVLSQPRVQLSTRARVLEAIAAMHPAPGQGCVVFVTSHGAHDRGVYLAPRTEFLTPGDLDTALHAGCGAAPTVSIVSACYSGGFAHGPLAQPNRVLLTAAAADRPSFGCGAGREFTFYDQCLLRTLGSHPADWPAAIAETARCVTGLEAADHEAASQPQGFVGGTTAGLPVFGG